MARPKKNTARGRKTTTKSTARGKAKQTKEFHPHKERAQMTTNLKAQTAEIKLLKGNDLTRRPPKNPDMPKDIIDNLNTDFNSIKELLDAFSQHLRALDRCRKAKGFSAWSLRYAQTPHINSWSFAKHNTSQKRINFFKNKNNNKNCNLLFGKTPSYTA